MLLTIGSCPALVSETQHSAVDRRKNLAELCAAWSGVIAVAAYVPLLNGTGYPEAGASEGPDVPEVIATLATFHKTMDTQGAPLPSCDACS